MVLLPCDLFVSHANNEENALAVDIVTIYVFASVCCH